VADLDEARGRFEAIQTECDRDDLRHTVITEPTDGMSEAQLSQLCKDNNAFAADIQAALGIIWEHAAAGLVAVADDQPVTPPAATWHGPAPGFYAAWRYGSAPRQWGNLTVPTGVPKGVLVQVHGGGWMQGDPNVAVPEPSVKPAARLAVDAGPAHHSYEALLGPVGSLPYGLREMASYAAQRWQVVVWEPAYTYSSGDPTVCLVDVEAAIHWLYARLNEWGASQLPVVYAGHSAGGQLSLRAALDPAVPAPKAWLGMAAAGLTVHRVADVQDAPGGFAPGGTGWIFTTAWGPVGTWPEHAPDTHLNQRPERFPLVVEQGSLNGHDDGSVNVRWAGGVVLLPATYGEQNGADHFRIRWDVSAITRGHMDAIWASV
jgi:acetyl esterase/lipase